MRLNTFLTDLYMYGVPELELPINCVYVLLHNTPEIQCISRTYMKHTLTLYVNL